ncbi:unnamed protein product [Lepeophtheirus salmonis]|uniref:(salmon louse) hypothetical protein n=1 Tax=Lepeophtheirus salmonis TaxID=72036 RepID=A0A7R8CAG1_LEPSM|nr:unnamed protein product [Lepeophtheirus salmonis]CAF2750669.1 unnamed protein product [Lepeophtheirus salmonis]
MDTAGSIEEKQGSRIGKNSIYGSNIEDPCSPTVIHSAVCDDKKSYCKANAFKCMDPNYYFNCRKSCGCRGNCHDVSANCIMWPAGCLESESCEKCPRFCGFCEGCNDVFKEELCQKLVRYCYNENVGYFCSKTCNKCVCQDRLKYNSESDSFALRMDTEGSIQEPQGSQIGIFFTCGSNIEGNKLDKVGKKKVSTSTDEEKDEGKSMRSH